MCTVSSLQALESFLEGLLPKARSRWWSIWSILELHIEKQSTTFLSLFWSVQEAYRNRTRMKHLQEPLHCIYTEDQKIKWLWINVIIYKCQFKTKLANQTREKVAIIINTLDQMTNAQAESPFATLILIGCRDVKQLHPANEILRIPFQCQCWHQFLKTSLHLLALYFCSEHLMF